MRCNVQSTNILGALLKSVVTKTKTRKKDERWKDTDSKTSAIEKLNQMK